MKKIISFFVLAVTMLAFMTLSGCKDNETSEEITELNGVWTFSYATYNDDNIKLKYGSEVSIYFKGGICKVKENDNIISGNYKVKGNEITYTFNDKFYTMTSNDGGNTMQYVEKDDNNILCIYYKRTGNIDESEWIIDDTSSEET